ncbi:MAG: Acg family FMN-binding oxidoreductase [Inquilinaceae bacterium]
MVSRRGLLISGATIAAVGGLTHALWPNLDAYTEAVARQRQALASEPRLLDFVRYATLAANGHNTQPWRFRIAEDEISILPDFTRRTEIVDPDDHHLLVSLGCAAENLAIAAAAHGRSAEVGVTNDGETRLAVALSRSQARESPLYAAIPHRQSTRSVYDGRPVSAADLQALTSAAREDGVRVLVFTAPEEREALLELVVAGNSAQVNDPAFVAELRAWLRFSPEQALSTRDGLFSACAGHPVLPAWAGGFFFNLLFTEGSENDRYRDQIRSSAGIAVFIGDRQTPEHWIRVGRSFERFALQATALGIRTAHINQPVEVPAVRRDLAGWLGAQETRPDLVVRFGHAPPLPMSLRRTADAVIL